MAGVSSTRAGSESAAPFAALKARQAQVWSSAPFELIADDAAPIHDSLVTHLGVRRGEDWLDVATGTGAVACRAARRGAVVTGQDLAPGLIQTARRLAAAEHLDIRFEVGDVEELPYADASFDVVSSAQGAVFAPDHRAVARELARVLRPGGRLGLTAWRPGGAIEKFFQTLARFQPPPVSGAGNPLDWGRHDYAADMLGDAFTLSFFDEETPQHFETAEAGWQLYSTAFGPVKVVADSFDKERRTELREQFIAYYDQYHVNGRIAAPREYVVIVGTRVG